MQQSRNAADLENWTCPILQTVMRDPVVAADGHTYERAAMEEWFRSCRDAEVTSPMTGFPLPSRILFANHNLRKSIADYVTLHPEVEAQMTTKDEIAEIVNRFRSGEARPGSPPLIDLRTEEEIAAADIAAKPSSAQVSAQVVDPPAVPLTAPVPASAPVQAKAVQGASYTLAPPSTLLVGSRISHHSQSNELDLFEANASGFFQSCRRTKMDNSATFTCASMLRLPSDDPFRNFDSQYVVTGGSSGSLSMYAYGHASGPTLQSIQVNADLRYAHSEGITCLSTWPHSASVLGETTRPIIVSGSRDRSLKVWKAESLVPLKHGSLSWNFNQEATLEHHTDFVTCCEVEIGSGTLLSGGGDWKSCLWDLHRPDAGCIREFESHSYAVRCCSWSSSGQQAVNGFQSVAHATCSEGAFSQQRQQVAPPPSSACFATGGDDEMVYVIDPRSSNSDGKVARLSTGAAVLTVCWGPMDDVPGGLPWLAAGGGVPLDSFNANSDNLGGWIRIWDPRMWKAIGDCTSFGATPLQDPSGAAHDYQASERKLRLHRASSSKWESDKSREAHATMVAGLSPVRVADGTIALASVGDDHALRLWKLPRGPGDSILKPQLLQNIQTHSSPCYIGLLI